VIQLPAGRRPSPRPQRAGARLTARQQLLATVSHRRRPGRGGLGPKVTTSSSTRAHPQRWEWGWGGVHSSLAGYRILRRPANINRRIVVAIGSR
jgi:hypothetical protein